MGRACSTCGRQERLWCGNVRERVHLEEPGVDGRVILKRIFNNWDWGGSGFDPSGSGHEHVAGFCEFGNEPSVFIKCGEFLA